MVKFIESELIRIRREIDQMWTLVSSQMDLVREAVLTFDRQKAQQVMVREKRVDAYELKIDSEVEDFIALYTPVAVDLRFVLAMLKINNDLERIGDYADGIARFVVSAGDRKPDPEFMEALQVEKMFVTVLAMLEELQTALTEEDARMATGVLAKDDVLDGINRASVGVLAAYARKNPDNIDLCLEMGSVFRKLERTGDHLTNIAEEIVFYIDAKVLKHRDSIPTGDKKPE